MSRVNVGYETKLMINTLRSKIGMYRYKFE